MSDTEQKNPINLTISELTQRLPHAFSDYVHVVTNIGRGMTAMTFVQTDPLLRNAEDALQVTAVAKVIMPYDAAKRLHEQLGKSIRKLDEALSLGDAEYVEE